MSPIGAPGGAGAAGMMPAGVRGPLEEALDVGREQRVLRQIGFALADLGAQARGQLAAA